MLATSATAFAFIKYLGAAYLLWLAFGMLRDAVRGADVAALRALAPAPARAVFAQGFLGNALNPKVALFFLALLPQFVAADAANRPLAFLFLGLLFIAVGAVVLAGVVVLAVRARRLALSPVGTRALSAIGGALFVGLAARLATAERN